MDTSRRTRESDESLRLARQIESACPPELGTEIVLAGSAARGVSDRWSDIELNFFVQELEWPAERASWIESIGGSSIAIDQEAHETGSWWIEFVYGGVWVEAGWHDVDTAGRLLDEIISGNVADWMRLQFAEAIASGLVLRGGDTINAWKKRLQHYPDVVQARMVAEATRHLADPHWYHTFWTFANRPEPVAMMRRLQQGVHIILRLLFAINRLWESDPRKWIHESAARLTMKPDRLGERILSLYDDPVFPATFVFLMRLIQETLDLVPDKYDLGEERKALAEALRIYR